MIDRTNIIITVVRFDINLAGGRKVPVHSPSSTVAKCNQGSREGQGSIITRDLCIAFSLATSCIRGRGILPIRHRTLTPALPRHI